MQRCSREIGGVESLVALVSARVGQIRTVTRRRLINSRVTACC